MLLKKCSVLCLFLLFSANAISDKLTISVQDFPPFTTVEQGRISGPFVEIVEKISVHSEIEIEILLHPNRRSKALLKEGYVNANFPLGWNEERDKWLHWSLPLMSTEYGFFTRTNEAKEYKSIESFSGLKVGVFGPSNTSYSLERLSEDLEEKGLGPINVKMLPNSNGQNLKKLVAKRIDAVYLNRDLGEYQIKALEIVGAEYLLGVEQINYYIGFSKENTSKDLVDKFNESIRYLKDKGEISTILSTYKIRAAYEEIE
ncbi:substrate-binding periplasmic protein [Neptuniibacter sp. SY11_33]|uniref:substrate-binding periplasmic protein n=1 Tax=Neptuniibacter sp. SY11_33 TaxID=3398215 RepID=UPI0039F49CD2